LQNTVGGQEITEITALAAQYKIPASKVPIDKLNGFNIGVHEGCVALLSKIQYQDLQEVDFVCGRKREVPLFLILDGITDIRNIGGMARTPFAWA
jgi:23S rRNA (guanosine2251-2'-O)-methyltransferase